MATNKSFSYTKDEGKAIIVEDTLLELDFDQEHAQRTDTRKLHIDLQKLSEKEVKLNLHIITLSDYWRQDMIPRGLRLNKFPSFGYDNVDFKDKWEAILNKCSLDLILLLIEEARKQKSVVQSHIEDLKSQLIQTESEEHRLPFENKLKEDLDKLSTKLKQGKIIKFKRDCNDYSNCSIYGWGKKGHLTKRRVSFNLPSTDDENYDETHDRDKIADVYDRNAFLESRPRQHNQPYKRGRGKRGGVESGRTHSQEPPITRSRLKHR
ncbi:uncharacterized protein LOC127987457 [Carassius gibelio]|uniref:uncharacterized protein LOC127987456 n=1 Tax=Carassius gibelio TaxID=101364 RepID=UPI0022781B4F|nr:uncharacterized protein LOC127987456 [Carassius gibelio]XP_052445762.1 uncharacterized protein LOC127987457 [Carassius gibelio]